MLVPLGRGIRDAQLGRDPVQLHPGRQLFEKEPLAFGELSEDALHELQELLPLDRRRGIVLSAAPGVYRPVAAGATDARAARKLRGVHGAVMVAFLPPPALGAVAEAVVGDAQDEAPETPGPASATALGVKPRDGLVHREHRGLF